MSRSGYSDDCDGWDLIRWRGAVTSALRGRRGQAFLRELAAEMDTMPQKELIEEELVTEDGKCCTMGVICRSRGIDASGVNPENSDAVAEMIGLSPAMVQEIAYQNDECSWREETPEQRWIRMRRWVAEHIIP